MDRRYRSNMGNNCGSSKNISSSRHEPACGDMVREHMHEEMCEHDRHDGDFDRFPLAMCYVPWQCFRDIYENEFEALANGTLFKELDLKWYGRGCR